MYAEKAMPYLQLGKARMETGEIKQLRTQVQKLQRELKEITNTFHTFIREKDREALERDMNETDKMIDEEHKEIEKKLYGEK